APPGQRRSPSATAAIPPRRVPPTRSWRIEAFGGWATGPVPIRAASLPGGHQMSVKTICLGWHWQPYQCTRSARKSSPGATADRGWQPQRELPWLLLDEPEAGLVDLPAIDQHGEVVRVRFGHDEPV